MTLGERFLVLARRPDVWSMGTVVVLKALMVAVNFALIVLAARTLGAKEFGYYSILFSAGSLLFVVAAAGQELFVIRSWSEFTAAKDMGRLRGAIEFSFGIGLLGCLAVAAGLFPWALSAFDLNTALAVTAFVTFAALLQISSHLMRAVKGVAFGDGVGHAFQFLPAVVYLSAALATGTEATTALVFFFFAAGAMVGLGFHAVLLVREVTQRLPGFFGVRGLMERAVWLRRSGRLWMANSLEATNQYADVLIIGLLMSPTAAGAYFVIVRLSNLLGAAADSINLYATKHFPSLYYGGERRELSTFLDGVAWITLAFIVIGLAGIAAGGYFALLVISQDYAGYLPELLVLCLGTAALAVARPCALILMLTGHEGRYLQVLAGTVGLRIAGLFLLVPYFGVLGAVTASAISFAVAALVLRNATKSRTGLDPTLARLWSAKGETAYARPAE